MTSILLKQKISKRSLTLNKSFILSLAFHSFLILGITFTTFYQIPVLKKSPIINVKLANSSEDIFGNENFNQDLLTTDSKGRGEKQIKSNTNSYQPHKIKKLEANSVVSNEEAVYLNLWQRNIESIGDKIIAKENGSFNESRVQIMATIDSFGNLIKSEILISSGINSVDQLALNILNEAAPFAPFDPKMVDEYSVLEIVRDWNFSSN